MPKDNEFVVIPPCEVCGPCTEEKKLFKTGVYRQVLVLFKPYGEDKIYFYDQHLTMITNFRQLWEADTLIITNQIRRYDSKLEGTVLFHDIVAIKGTPRDLKKFTLHTSEDNEYHFKSQYDLYEWSQKPAVTKKIRSILIE